jgi:L-2-hydroxycarboxylate dehydrogenase (NAD+)
MSEFLVVPRADHDALVCRAYQARGFTAQEAAEGAKLAAEAARHGIRTHHALKALHLDDLFGSAAGGCVPGAEIEVLSSRFPASERWNAHKKLGQSVAYRAINRAIELADQYGIAQISVDNAFHYLWGGGYVMEAAERGYYAYTNCTSALAEVVPFGGKFPTLGTNPHSWGIPSSAANGFPIVIDWATSTVAMGRVQALQREGKALPPGAAVDANGQATTDPAVVAALLPFGGHKGYGLCLLNEIFAALIGGSLPTLRGRKPLTPNEKNTPVFYFQVIHPEALTADHFACGRSQIQNLRAVLDDIRGHGNDGAILPGQPEAAARKRSDAAGGLLFTAAEVAEFNQIAAALGMPGWDVTKLTGIAEQKQIPETLRQREETQCQSLRANEALLKETHHRNGLQDADIHAKAATLTPREREIVRCVMAGLLNKEIAAQLDLAVITVKVHRGRAMRKLGAGNSAELVHLATQAGLLHE